MLYVFVRVTYHREAIEAAEGLDKLNKSKDELSKDGVPYELCMEIARSVLDAELPDSKEILFYEDDDEDDK